jgi:hypothetical protein
MVGRERVQEFGIVKRATSVTSVMVDDATNRGVPLADADESPMIARDGRLQWRRRCIGPAWHRPWMATKGGANNKTERRR